MNEFKIDHGWGTYAWAAEQLGLSVRQVGRYVRDGILTASRPRVGSRESARTKLMVSVDAVMELKRARQVAGRG